MSKSSLCSIRFGYGLAPDQPRIANADDLLAQLTRISHFDFVPMSKRRSLLKNYREARRSEKLGKGSKAQSKKTALALRRVILADLKGQFIRQIGSSDGFVERLVTFWADHFTVSARSREVALAQGAYFEQAIRPNIAGKFADLLFDAVTHTAMLLYLDQNSSIGPNSKMGKSKNRGLNENLAREVLELHTLGADADYTQTDVTQFAELLTGLRITPKGVEFKHWFAEPGSKTLFGKNYGGRRGKLSDIRAALEDIAVRPETARHLAQKLAVHFVADAPDPDLVTRVERAYLESGGHLIVAYEALLAHEAAWAPELRKVKRPRDLIVSALRGMALGDKLDALDEKEFRQGILKPMEAMGQSPNKPPGPDGWPEEAAHWITPATLTARIEWASALARHYGGELDPRGFLDMALRDVAAERTRFLVSGAESKWEGVALVLSSPEFNRR